MEVHIDDVAPLVEGHVEEATLSLDACCIHKRINQTKFARISTSAFSVHSGRLHQRCTPRSVNGRQIERSDHEAVGP